MAEVATAENLLNTDPVKHYAAIYLKGHCQRSIKVSNTSSELFQLADCVIGVLLSKRVQPSLKVHV